MTAKYFALLTNVGAAKLANATALGEKLEITTMAVGDANGTDPTPDPAQTKLVHECHRAPLNSLRVDPNNASQVIAEQVLTETVGGWWVREIGLYDTNGDLVAIGNCPPSYKPLMTEGSGREQIIRMILIVSSSDSVELKIDPSVVLATREYVDDAIETHAKSRNHPDATTTAKGLVQLSSATNSTSETLAATPKAVKAAYDLANGKLSSVPDATTSAKGIVQLSSATNSTSETLAATPKAVKAAYDLANGKLSSVPDATTAAKGIVQLSSATDSTSESLAATPKAVKAAVDSVASRMRQISLTSGSATHWLKIATMPPVVNSETRLEIELSGMSDYGVNAASMAVDRVYITTRGTSASTRVTAATVGNLIQQFSLGRSVDTQNYLVGVTEEVTGGNTTKYNFWLKMSNHTGISSTMNILNSRYSGVTVISDFSGANNSATEPAGIVYATRQQFFTTANPQQAADVRNNAAARMGVSRVLTGATGPSSPGVWSVENSTWAGVPWGSVICTTNGSDLSTAAGSGKFNHYLQISHEAGGKPGLRVAVNINGTFSGWDRVMMTSGGTFTSPVTAPNFATTPDAKPVGAGTYAEQLGNQAPFFQPNWQWPTTPGGVFVPIAKGTSTRKDKGWPTAISYGYLMPGEDMHAHPVIHALGDGGMESIWEFNTQTGGIHSGKAGEFATLDRDIPPGLMLPWPTENPPAGWFLCNGAGFDRNTYPRLGGVLTNGVLPDLRGVFLRGKDNGRGINPNRLLGDIEWSQAPASAIGGGDWGNYAGRDTGHTATTGTDNSGNYRVMQESEQQRETRPTNVSVNYIVRAA